MLYKIFIPDQPECAMGGYISRVELDLDGKCKVWTALVTNRILSLPLKHARKYIQIIKKQEPDLIIKLEVVNG